MPGGYDGYFGSLRWTAETAQEDPPSKAELTDRMAREFELTKRAARDRLNFLTKVGIFRVESGVLALPEFMGSWLVDGDPIPLVVQLHLGVQFIGEMLEALEQPTTTAKLRRWACEQYSMGWETDTQVSNRRGWLQSAGLVGRDDDGCLYRTDAGIAFLEHVILEPPLEGRSGERSTAADAKEGYRDGAESDRSGSEPVEEQDAMLSDRTASVVREILDSSTDSKNSARFELAVRDAFRLLGFAAEHLGGPGKTDVLLDARLGRDASYRVAIDAKTTSAASLPEHQVDWDTLTDHRQKHQANYSMLVAPNPSPGRLMDRAERHGVAVLSAEALAALCELHAAQPLGLSEYRSIFDQGGEVDLSKIEERADAGSRQMALGKRLVDAIADLAQDLGPLTASKLQLTMYHQDPEDLPTEEEIEAVLASLVSPLVRAIEGQPSTGYVLASSPAVTAERLRILGETLSAS